MESQATWKDYLQLHFIVLLWGFTAILGKLITIPAVEIVFYRTMFAAIGLGFLLYFRKRKLNLGTSEITKMLLTGILIAAHWILFFAAARVSTVSVCLAGMATITLWTSILEPIAFKRNVKPYEVLLGILIIIGLYIIFKFQFNHALGLLMAVASAFLASLFTVINGKFTQRHNGYVVTLWEMIGACLSIAVFLPLYKNTLAPDKELHLVPVELDWVYILILALVCTVYAYSASVELQKKLSAFTVNLSVNMEPVYGIILAFFIFNEAEQMTTGFYIGTSIILLAVMIYPALVKWDKRRQLRIRKLQ